jgi:hypothetical protein
MLKIIAALLLGLGLTGIQAQTIYVRQESGTQTAYELSKITKMSFSSGNISVSKTNGISDTYLLSDLRYLNFQDLTTKIEMVKQQDEVIQVFPNPVIDLLNIQLSAKGSQDYIIEILSINGKVIYQEKIIQQYNTYKINVSLLPQGIYFCKINNGIKTETTKFIKY